MFQHTTDVAATEQIRSDTSLCRTCAVSNSAITPATGTNPAGSPAAAAQDPKLLILNSAELKAIERLNLERVLVVANGKNSGAGGVAEMLGLPASRASFRLKALGMQRNS